MLGWEFPPHISGGLGVACEGLTSALIKTDEVQILFVVPKADSSQDGEVKVLGANNLSISTYETAHVHEEVFVEDVLHVAEINASLDPYEQLYHVDAKEFLSKWNSSNYFPRSTKRTVGYQFEGGYGNKLLFEVDKYAEILVAFALEQEFDVIHAHDWMTFPAAVALKNATGKPLVVHIHATEFDRAGVGSELVHEIERMAVQYADKIIAVSNLTAKTLINRYQAPRDRIEVVHNGVQYNDWTPLANKIHPLGDQLVSFVGRITFQKGPEYFVDAAEKVLKEFPNCHFVMAGAGDALITMIRRVISKKLSARFHFTGFLGKADVARLLSYSRVYVMPSVSEPFGLTALEAVNAGVPVVVSLQSGVTEVLPDVLKVDFWDTDALARAISGVLRYPLLAETMRQNARQSVPAISWDTAASKVLNIYRNLVSRDVPSLL